MYFKINDYLKNNVTSLFCINVDSYYAKLQQRYQSKIVAYVIYFSKNDQCSVTYGSTNKLSDS